jgi:hypothetical protein
LRSPPLGFGCFPFLLFSKPSTFPLFARFQLVFSAVSMQNSTLAVLMLIFYKIFFFQWYISKIVLAVKFYVETIELRFKSNVSKITCWDLANVAEENLLRKILYEILQTYY